MWPSCDNTPQSIIWEHLSLHFLMRAFTNISSAGYQSVRGLAESAACPPPTCPNPSWIMHGWHLTSELWADKEGICRLRSRAHVKATERGTGNEQHRGSAAATEQVNLYINGFPLQTEMLGQVVRHTHQTLFSMEGLFGQAVGFGLKWVEAGEALLHWKSLGGKKRERRIATIEDYLSGKPPSK